MTEHRQHLTTEDFAERTPAGHDTVDHTTVDRDAVDRDAFARDSFGDDTAGHDTLDRGTADQQHDGLRHDGGQYDGLQHDGHEPVGQQHDGRDAVDQTPADHDVAEPDLTDQERLDHEPVPQQHDEQAAPAEPVEVSTTAGDAPLFTADDAADYQAEWRALQADFVDDPREAVQRADELVAQVMQSLATTFTQHKHALEEQWQRGDEAQTEELRQALKRYRSFFDRLLSV